MHGIPAKFQIRLLRDDEPRPNLSWEFVIDGTRKVSGTTDSDGWIRVSLMPDARQGRLSIEGGAEVYDVQFGFVDPIDTPTGVQSRLSNLGFFDGDLADAIARFQQSRELPMTGEIDQATRAALQQIFGS
jgi:murein L,D-transpeptidase YcbB/YkuD